MKVLSSLKSAKARHRDCKVVRRRGKIFVICKSNPRFKARQRRADWRPPPAESARIPVFAESRPRAAFCIFVPRSRPAAYPAPAVSAARMPRPAARNRVACRFIDAVFLL